MARVAVSVCTCRQPLCTLSLSMRSVSADIQSMAMNASKYCSCVCDTGWIGTDSVVHSSARCPGHLSLCETWRESARLLLLLACLSLTPKSAAPHRLQDFTHGQGPRLRLCRQAQVCLRRRALPFCTRLLEREREQSTHATPTWSGAADIPTDSNKAPFTGCDSSSCAWEYGWKCVSASEKVLSTPRAVHLDCTQRGFGGVSHLRRTLSQLRSPWNFMVLPSPALRVSSFFIWFSRFSMTCKLCSLACCFSVNREQTRTSGVHVVHFVSMRGLQALEACELLRSATAKPPPASSVK